MPAALDEQLIRRDRRGSSRSIATAVQERGSHQGSTRTSKPGPSLMQILVRGLVAGAAGVTAMTLAEKLEQAVTRRSNSYVPAHTLEKLLGLPAKPDAERLWLNWAMHWGQGIALGPVRALMAEKGFRGPVASFLVITHPLARVGFR